MIHSAGPIGMRIIYHAAARILDLLSIYCVVFPTPPHYEKRKMITRQNEEYYANAIWIHVLRSISRLSKKRHDTFGDQDVYPSANPGALVAWCGVQFREDLVATTHRSEGLVRIHSTTLRGSFVHVLQRCLRIGDILGEGMMIATTISGRRRIEDHQRYLGGLPHVRLYKLHGYKEAAMKVY